MRGYTEKGLALSRPEVGNDGLHSGVAGDVSKIMATRWALGILRT